MTSLLVIAPIREIQNKMNSLVKNLENITGIYVSLNEPQENVQYILKKVGINTENLFFIDCFVSKEKNSDILRIDPARLDLLNAAVESLIKKIEGQKILVIDALSTLLIYNDENKVVKFVKKLIEDCSRNGVRVVAFTPKTEEKLLIKISNFFDGILEEKKSKS
jgi:KaiC/GvpD/RAD55 family RecA-like ATPase